MLIINRTDASLSPDELTLRELLDRYPRTAPRPTDQFSGELKDPALSASLGVPAASSDEEDIDFSPVPDDAPFAPLPSTTPTATTFITKGVPAMLFKQFRNGGCLIQAYTSDMAVLALVLRHAASSEQLFDLAPTMTTTLDSLAAAFELGTVMALQQTGYLPDMDAQPLNAEQVQAWCQRVVQGGVDAVGATEYTVAPHDSEIVEG